MSNSIPQYRQLYEILRKQIMDGVYRPGDLLPSENDLCQQHGITRPTVRHALDTMLNEGMIRKHKGKGSIVNGPADRNRDIIHFRNHLGVGQTQSQDKDFIQAGHYAMAGRFYVSSE